MKTLHVTEARANLNKVVDDGSVMSRRL